MKRITTVAFMLMLGLGMVACAGTTTTPAKSNGSAAKCAACKDGKKCATCKAKGSKKKCTSCKDGKKCATCKAKGSKKKSAGSAKKGN